MSEAADHLRRAVEEEKCWRCGCLHESLSILESHAPDVVRDARDRLQDVEYGCLGCDECHSALAVAALPEVEVSREGWPPLPGDHVLLRHQAPVAICTLTDDALLQAVALEAGLEVAIAGTLQTENLGIERLVLNTLANPTIRFLVVCGADSEGAVGHCPGGSLVALGKSGVDGEGRIIDAPGKRPILRNLDRAAVDHFRNTVEIVDLVGRHDVEGILATARECHARDPGPAEAYRAEEVIRPTRGYLPERTVPDPAGWIVIYVDRRRRLLSIEHYRTDGVLDAVIDGPTAAEAYTPAIERGLVTRLDHAAYLGRELGRAEEALRSGRPYVQDAAPERDEGCGPSCCHG